MLTLVTGESQFLKPLPTEKQNGGNYWIFLHHHVGVGSSAVEALVVLRRADKRKCSSSDFRVKFSRIFRVFFKRCQIDGDDGHCSDVDHGALISQI